MNMSRLIKSSAVALAMSLALPAHADVVLINVFEVPDGQEEQVVAAWEKARDFLSNQPGYVSTRLHQSLDPEARFSLINVAKWENPEAFQAAIANMNQANIFPEIDGLNYTPALYNIVSDD